MRRLMVFAALIATGCSARPAPVEGGKWISSGAAPHDPPGFALRTLAGEYDTHDPGSGWTALRLGADGRWTWRSGTLWDDGDFSSGTAYVSGDSVVFEKNDAIGFPTSDFVVLRPVRWGERVYLLAPEEFVRFCNHVNWGSEPNRLMWGRFPLRDEGAIRPNVIRAAKGCPDLPEPWKKAILRRPIEGEIRERLADGTYRASVGGAHGVFPGMELRTGDAMGRFFQVLEVVSFTDDECILRSAWAEETESPQVGWKVTCDAQGAEFAPP